ncbi:hypothetical protein Tc00.1047053511603.40 [Trypanosoma cruzi]|uniref:Uncharacterized protein n=1 Tax=Trypanosoma cruzi (strain CL Brener) TaxID=353153 RepID=Q4E2C4_TRYCC|nr:hypothetical protein Tc00.1047053511603.40 [Trypanosoma cruzi]EAN98902.1 hypothetical protein Tc00.1047053511603.40 [Trypanosoma cruzi]|eukprot:XP_820753.1 hypothetical protein [Trypanosoma cruzi strain CL Brener]
MRGKCTATERHPALSLQGNVHPQNIWTRHHQTHMPFHAPINRSEGALWCVGVHSHIFIPTAINGEESGATATKRGKQTSIAALYQRKAGTTQTELLAAPTQATFTGGKKNIIVHPAGIPNTRPRHEGLPSAKQKQKKNICGHRPTLNRNTNKWLLALFHSLRPYFFGCAAAMAVLA